jgi:hypothetical protein
MTKERTLGVVFRGYEIEVRFLRPLRQQGFNDMPCIPTRVRRTGMENPRFPLEAPETRMTLDTRQRQLHDEDKSCGIQPAYIRMIYRRLSSCTLTGIHGLNKKEYKKAA